MESNPIWIARWSQSTQRPGCQSCIRPLLTRAFRRFARRSIPNILFSMEKVNIVVFGVDIAITPLAVLLQQCVSLDSL